MVIAALLILGLVLGSFVNALVWRLRQQELQRIKKQESRSKYSVVSGRSMCPHCKHELAAKDLVPVFSWLTLKGKCRYCQKPISIQYPLVELATALLFVASYVWWPVAIHGLEEAVFGLWLPIVVGLVALFIYDMRWMLLPDRIIFPLTGIAAVQALVRICSSAQPLTTFRDEILAVIIGAGVFYLIFQISDGKWIGGGDVKFGLVFGLVVAVPGKSLLVIFLASVLGTLVSLPLLSTKKLGRTSSIPFGPFLIAATFLVVLFGQSMLDWYSRTFLLIGS